LEGQLGQDSSDIRKSSVPLLVDIPIMPIIAFADAGYLSTCAVDVDGRLVCFGDNRYGELGYEDTTQRGDNAGDMASLQFVDLGVDFAVHSVSAGSYHRCVTSTTQQMKCFGSGSFGALGSGSISAIGDSANSMGDNLSPLDFGPDFNVSAVSDGGIPRHHCVVSDEATFKCFGRNDGGGDYNAGQLGLGDLENRGDDADEMGAALPFVQFEFTTAQPTREPTVPTQTPSTEPSSEPTMLTVAPTAFPSTHPSTSPSSEPSVSANPTREPTEAPIETPSDNQSKSAAKTLIFAVSVGVCFCLML